MCAPWLEQREEQMEEVMRSHVLVLNRMQAALNRTNAISILEDASPTKSVRPGSGSACGQNSCTGREFFIDNFRILHS